MISIIRGCPKRIRSGGTCCIDCIVDGGGRQPVCGPAVKPDSRAPDDKAAGRMRRVEWEQMRTSILVLLAALAFGHKYSGPRPPKPDIVYLVHADNLVSTEAVEARQESKKNEAQFTVSGASSSARTPLA